MNTVTTPAASLDDRMIVTTRLIDAPRALVFRLYREPERLARCWGPTGFRNTFHEYDFRPGGHWRFIMHGPDGTDYPNHSVFEEIVAPERIVFRHLDPLHEFQMTVLLEERGPKTQLTWHMRFETVEYYERVRSFVVPANEQNFDRIEAELAGMSAS
ncbi:MAG: SRPBCC family protein [Chthoniobacter sp.]